MFTVMRNVCLCFWEGGKGIGFVLNEPVSVQTCHTSHVGTDGVGESLV